MIKKSFFKTIIEKSKKDEIGIRAAALSFYTLISLIPILVIIIKIFSAIVSPQRAGELIEKAALIGGVRAAEVLHNLLITSQQTSITSLTSLIVLLIASTALFTNLYNTLNKIWEVTPEKKEIYGFRKHLGKRALAFFLVMLFSTTFIILTSLPVILNKLIESTTILILSSYTIAFIIMTFFLAYIYKIMIGDKIRYLNMLQGSAITALLLTAGQIILGIYFRYSSIPSIYGAASYLIVLTLWIYYSAWAFLISAEITYLKSKQR